MGAMSGDCIDDNTFSLSNVDKLAEWPNQWKLEHIVPIGKIPLPESENDLRPISLTAFISKVTEHFVIMWLLEFLQDKIDFLHQDSTDQTEFCACIVDFSKAFNRI